MQEWVARQMMPTEAGARVGAEKGKHSQDRKKILFWRPSKMDGYQAGHDLSLYPEAEEGRTGAVFCDMGKALGAGPGVRVVDQWSLDTAGRTVGQGSWD